MPDFGVTLNVYVFWRSRQLGLTQFGNPVATRGIQCCNFQSSRCRSESPFWTLNNPKSSRPTSECQRQQCLASVEFVLGAAKGISSKTCCSQIARRRCQESPKFQMLQVARMSALRAEFIVTIDPRPHDFGEFCALVLITKVATVFEDGQNALGQSRV